MRRGPALVLGSGRGAPGATEDVGMTLIYLLTVRSRDVGAVYEPGCGAALPAATPAVYEPGDAPPASASIAPVSTKDTEKKTSALTDGASPESIQFTQRLPESSSMTIKILMKYTF